MSVALAQLGGKAGNSQKPCDCPPSGPVSWAVGFDSFEMGLDNDVVGDSCRKSSMQEKEKKNTQARARAYGTVPIFSCSRI